MFHFAGTLEHLLPRSAYFQPESFERERAAIFHRSRTYFCLASQVAKYQNDLNVLKVYPIATIGVSYNFKVR